MDITLIFGLLGGLALFLYGMQMMSDGLENAAGILLWVATIRKKELNRTWGIIMLLGYVEYFAYLLVQA